MTESGIYIFIICGVLFIVGMIMYFANGGTIGEFISYRARTKTQDDMIKNNFLEAEIKKNKKK